MCIDRIGSHCFIEWYACIPKVLLAAKKLRQSWYSSLKGQQQTGQRCQCTQYWCVFWDLVTCRVACNVSIFAIKLQPAAAHWILLQGIPNRRASQAREHSRTAPALLDLCKLTSSRSCKERCQGAAGKCFGKVKRTATRSVKVGLRRSSVLSCRHASQGQHASN